MSRHLKAPFILLSILIFTVLLYRCSATPSDDPQTDTTFCIEDYTYRHQLTSTGRSPNAACDSYYIVYTNDPEISFQEVDTAFWSSQAYASHNEQFYILETGIVK